MKVRAALVTLLLLLLAGCAQQAEKPAEVPAETPVKTPAPEKGGYTGFKKLSYGEWAEWKTDLTPLLQVVRKKVRKGGELPETWTVRYKNIYLGERKVDGVRVYGYENQRVDIMTKAGATEEKKFVTQVWYSSGSHKAVASVVLSEGEASCAGVQSPEGVSVEAELFPGVPANASFITTPEPLKPENLKNYTLTSFTTESGKRVEAAVLRAKLPDGTGVELWVSSQVPFGIVKALDMPSVILVGLLAGFGGVGEDEEYLEKAASTYMLLSDFGTGAEPEIGWEEAESCIRQALQAPPKPRMETAEELTYPVVFEDTFETWEGWQQYANGRVDQSSELAKSGSFSLKKSKDRDPNGGYKIIGRKVGRGVVLEGWTYRPLSTVAPRKGGDALGLEDGDFNGYSFIVNHLGGFIAIHKRTSGEKTLISEKKPVETVEDGWYFWRFYIYENGTLSFEIYDSQKKWLGSVSAHDDSYSGFDRITVRGGYVYYVDDVKLREIGGG